MSSIAVILECGSTANSGRPASLEGTGVVSLGKVWDAEANSPSVTVLRQLRMRV